MTSWIDGSFVYSSQVGNKGRIDKKEKNLYLKSFLLQEAWVSTMRTFRNGTLKWMNGDGKAR